jgi:NADH-quinone oxidoreductase subunit J
MLTDMALFIVLALVAIASALGMLLSRNAIYSALNLIINFGTVAVFYLILNASFIALAQVTVYAGAIMVLFLFVIMLLGVERLRPSSAMPWQQPAAIILAVILSLEAMYVLFFRQPLNPAYPEVPQGFGSATSVGLALFNSYLLPFEITSILLLVAMIGAIVLSQRRKKGGVRGTD